MKRIDFYVQHLVRHSAVEVVLVSDEPVLFRFPQGERKSNTAIEHAQVTQLVQEAAPPPVFDTLRRSGRATFEHVAENGTVVRVEVLSLSPREWQVTLTPSESSGLRPAQSGTEPRPEPRPEPRSIPGEPEINRMLRSMAELDASDLHLCTGVVPMIRLDGEMRPLEERGAFTEEELAPLLLPILPSRNRAEFEERHDTDFAYAVPDVARFRVNYYRDMKGIAAVFRQIPFEILPPDKLGIPPQVLELCYLTKGLVLVTGPTGSGKSTTLASLLDLVNQKRADHIITIEDPIEFVHKNKRCLVNQREVGTHTTGFKTALRAALREDPDVVLVGELRDLETIAIAIETAETGHLVFGTLHTTSAPSTVDRIIDQFPADRQAQIRTMLSESLRGVIAQVLCKKKGGGRIAAYEVLIANSAVANLIREGKTYQLMSVMQTGKTLGMQTMNEHLLSLVKSDVVSAEEAFMRSNDKTGFRDLLKRAGVDLRLE
jgi:twitching motility protein PilT